MKRNNIQFTYGAQWESGDNRYELNDVITTQEQLEAAQERWDYDQQQICEGKMNKGDPYVMSTYQNTWGKRCEKVNPNPRPKGYKDLAKIDKLNYQAKQKKKLNK